MNVFPKAFVVAVALFFVPLLWSGCATTGVEYQSLDKSIELTPRPPECHIDDFELGREAKHENAFKVTGTLFWKLSKKQIEALGPEGVRRKLHRAACSYGLFLVSDITAFPDTQNGGATYEAKGAVLVDDKGNAINDAKPVDAPSESKP